jgi:serine/threonine-protein kinase
MDVFEPVGIGSDFLGYRIEELIGRGGMGVVYRAYDLRLKRMVALKLVAPVLARDERFRERFARESQLVMSLEHPNVVPIYDAGDVDDRVYLAMRLVDGSDLGALLRGEGALEPARAIAICEQVAAALDAAHARGLVHRDVKPSNVLLDTSEHAYLADFGLTRSLDEEAGDDRTAGTPAYLAPERLEGRRVDGSADIYALGCVLYECLTGEPVFPRGSRLAVAWAHLEEEPPRVTDRRRGFPASIDAVVARALAKEPGQRFETCRHLVAAAREALGLGAPRTSRRPPMLLAGAGILAIAAVGAVIVTTLAHGGGTAAPLRAGPNTLARIDTATHKVSDVVRVGTDPEVAAGNDYTVWVYNRGSGSVSQINGVTNHLVDTTPVSPPAECCSLFRGPVLTAGGSGGWFVERGTNGRGGWLVHIPIGQLNPSKYSLHITPTGVATGARAVWVVGHDSREDEVLRIDPTSGRVTKTTHFPRSAGVDSIAFGYGRVWVVSSSKATLYKIRPDSARVTNRLVLESQATRPEIMKRGPDIWVRTTDGLTNEIQPASMRISYSEYDGSPDWEENLGSLGSLWWYDWRLGKVYRQEVANGPIEKTRVTETLPRDGGQCLTSLTQAAGSIWVTVAPASGSTCKR